MTAKPESCDEWSLVVFASRESISVLQQTVRAVRLAGARLARIEVLVNGNELLAGQMSTLASQSEVFPPGPPIRVWSIRYGDKANAWNQYLHHVWNGESLAFFIDGYVKPGSGAVELLGEATLSDDRALAGSGTPSMGRSATAIREAMLREGGIHGNFCCFKRAAVETIRARGLKLPVGLYRTESMWGAMLCFSFDPLVHDWDPARILVHPTATWQTDEKHWWKLADMRAQVKRLGRQAKGDLEMAAMRDHFAVGKRQPEELPPTAEKMVRSWMVRSPATVARMLRFHPLRRQALTHMQTNAGWDSELAILELL